MKRLNDQLYWKLYEPLRKSFESRLSVNPQIQLRGQLEWQLYEQCYLQLYRRLSDQLRHKLCEEEI